MLIISVTQAPKKNNATPGKTPPDPTGTASSKSVSPAGNSNGGGPPTVRSGVKPTTTSSTTQAGKPGPAKPTPAGAPKGNLLSSCVNKKVIKFFTT